MPILDKDFKENVANKAVQVGELAASGIDLVKEKIISEMQATKWRDVAYSLVGATAISAGILLVYDKLKVKPVVEKVDELSSDITDIKDTVESTNETVSDLRKQLIDKEVIARKYEAPLYANADDYNVRRARAIYTNSLLDNSNLVRRPLSKVKTIKQSNYATDKSHDGDGDVRVVQKLE